MTWKKNSTNSICTYISKNLAYIFEHDILKVPTQRRLVIIGIPDVYCKNKI